MPNRARYIAIALLSLGAVIVVALVTLLAMGKRQTGGIPVDRGDYPVKGIDVSAHNGPEVDWQAVAADSVVFVYLRATDGDSYRDPRFYANYAGAVGAGLMVSAYHYFRFDTDGTAQAMNLLNAIQGLWMDMPVAVDVEDWANAKDVKAADVIDRLGQMLTALALHGHPGAVVYTNRNGFNRYVRFRYDDHPVWIASFTVPPLDAPWVLWQHSHVGRVSGIETPVDLDTYNGSAAQFQRWARAHRPVPRVKLPSPLPVPEEKEK